MVDHPTERGVGNWFFSGVQKHDKTQLLAKFRKDFPGQTEEAIEAALAAACNEVKISEGREKLEETLREKLTR